MWRKCKDRLPDDEERRIVIVRRKAGGLFRDLSWYDMNISEWAAFDTVIAWWDADLPSIPDEYY